MTLDVRRFKFIRPPRTLRWRLFLILLAGLTVAHALSFAVLFYERTVSAKATMLTSLESDVATSIALIDRLPSAEREQWLPLLHRRNYHYELGPGQPGVPELSTRATEIAHTINAAAGRRFPVSVQTIPGDGHEHLQAHVTLSDGSQVTIDVLPQAMPLANWLPYTFIAQLLLLIACTWLAVRLAIRPLLRFAKAAETLDPGKKAEPLEEGGPSEVAYASQAFNVMRDRIAHYLEERVRILAAISHDLQTPITRMRLRAEMSEDSPEKDKLTSDLAEIERLVREGVDYARSAHGNQEKPTRIDVGSFVESLAFDYQDTNKPVRYSGDANIVVTTRPHALRRILTNLVDNALKFGCTAEIQVERTTQGTVLITVLDEGPGIPMDKLDAVMQPFFRLEGSRNRETGGTGLGLAIAQQLAAAIGGELLLANRATGGLSAQIRMKQAGP